MSLQIKVNDQIQINNETYLFGEHPLAAGVPYGQEGRQGTVYLLNSLDQQRKMALKVFRSKFRNPSMVHLTDQIKKYSRMDGYAACDRSIITTQNNKELLNAHPDLLYAVLMPWIEGPTWMDMLLSKQTLSKRQSYTVAYSLAEILVTTEQRGLAHCDLSAPNVMLPMFKDGMNKARSSNLVQFIDLEQMYSTQIEQPEFLPAGSPGYAHQSKDPSLLWSGASDRFSGAVLLMEMLGSCDETFLSQAWGESYFAPSELQQYSERYDQLVSTIQTHWGDAILSLFQRAWESDSLEDCPTFGEWMLELSKVDPTKFKDTQNISIDKTVAIPSIMPDTPSNAKPIQPVNQELVNTQSLNSHELLQQAQKLENRGKMEEALDVYRSIIVKHPHSNVVKEVEIAIEQIEKTVQSRKEAAAARGAIPYKKWFVRLIKIGILAAIGWSLYQYHPVIIDKAKGVYVSLTTEKAEQEVNEEIERLLHIIEERDEEIEKLHKQLVDFERPFGDQKQELIQNLNQHYNEIRKIVEADPDEVRDAERQVFEHSEKIMIDLHAFIQFSFGLDEYTVDQFNNIEGYYFPYIYNRNRNAQLNYQFYDSYKDNFK